MEKLVTWLKDNKVTRRALAAHVGVVPSIISDGIRGRQRFSLVTACKIELATGGAVKCLDLADPTEIKGCGRLK